MAKKLSEMTLEELWQLFPIFLTEPKSCWKEWYLEEEKFLQSILPESIRIIHIGSIAIGTIWAKPIIDILGTPVRRYLVNRGLQSMVIKQKI